MGCDFIGLLLAILTAITAAPMTVVVLTLAWSSLGLLSVPLAVAAALFILVLGAMLDATLTSNKR